MSMRPILGSSCARAASAAEMRYRIDRPIRGRQGARIVGLDPGADAIVDRISQQHWGHARFLALAGPVGDTDGSESVPLRDSSGQPSNLLAELTDADVVIMVATTGADAAAATIIGAACTVRAIMTAGLVIGEHARIGPTVAALRPHARVLMVGGEERDVVDLLTALRA
ncbi:3-methyl-2-oxobutanoate hydroxymethyltransferase [Mycolicibacterium goodii]|uniref:3-methyl-2-oxobutanoate hydroxymethyltransferase n=1 Tax=Mycolicibacterium goodii TaxID=134601 RepID=A0A0K0XBS7_MYCGD|nr:3-methyl-2-oxobutanoate hydroxymethyltransferase [Mycolicibacterium goodii]